MPQMQVSPIEIITSPNYYSYLKDSQWVVGDGIAATLAGQIWIVDALGSRPYFLPSTANLKVTFLRADTPQVVTAAQSIMKTVVPDSLERSIFTFALTTQDAKLVISGSVIFELTDTNLSNINQSWVQNYGVLKKMIGPGF